MHTHERVRWKPKLPAPRRRGQLVPGHGTTTVAGHLSALAPTVRVKLLQADPEGTLSEALDEAEATAEGDASIGTGDGRTSRAGSRAGSEAGGAAAAGAIGAAQARRKRSSVARREDLVRDLLRERREWLSKVRNARCFRCCETPD